MTSTTPPPCVQVTHVVPAGAAPSIIVQASCSQVACLCILFRSSADPGESACLQGPKGAPLTLNLSSVSGSNPLGEEHWSAAGAAESQELQAWMQEQGQTLTLAEASRVVQKHA